MPNPEDVILLGREDEESIGNAMDVLGKTNSEDGANFSQSSIHDSFLNQNSLLNDIPDPHLDSDGPTNEKQEFIFQAKDDSIQRDMSF